MCLCRHRYAEEVRKRLVAFNGPEYAEVGELLEVGRFRVTDEHHRTSRRDTLLFSKALLICKLRPDGEINVKRMWTMDSFFLKYAPSCPPPSSLVPSSPAEQVVQPNSVCQLPFPRSGCTLAVEAQIASPHSPCCPRRTLHIPPVGIISTVSHEQLKFRVRLTSNQKVSYTFCCDDAQEKSLWCERIREAMVRYYTLGDGRPKAGSGVPGRTSSASSAHAEGPAAPTRKTSGGTASPGGEQAQKRSKLFDLLHGKLKRGGEKKARRPSSPFRSGSTSKVSPSQSPVPMAGAQDSLGGGSTTGGDALTSPVKTKAKRFRRKKADAKSPTVSSVTISRTGSDPAASRHPSASSASEALAKRQSDPGEVTIRFPDGDAVKVPLRRRNAQSKRPSLQDLCSSSMSERRYSVEDCVVRLEDQDPGVYPLSWGMDASAIPAGSEVRVCQVRPAGCLWLEA